MSEINDELRETLERLKKECNTCGVDRAMFSTLRYEQPKFEIPELPDIEDSIFGEIRRNQVTQIEALKDQNRILQESYDELKKNYDLKVEELHKSDIELQKSKKDNKLSLVYTVIATIVGSLIGAGATIISVTVF